jgi:hypothetical protein
MIMQSQFGVRDPLPHPAAKRGHLLVFGDSHCVIWEGNNVLERAAGPKFDCVKVFHLGPALAFNLMDQNSTNIGKWGVEIFALIENFEASGSEISGVMLCFGEIDIRTQVILRAVKGGMTIEESVARVTDRVLDFAGRLHARFKHPVLVWEPVPTASQNGTVEVFNTQFPATGSEIERNYATRCFSNLMQAGSAGLRSKGHKVFSFGAFKQLASGFETRVEYFDDGCHLNLKGFDVALDELGTLCSEHNLGFDRLFVTATDFLKNPISREITGQTKVNRSGENFGLLSEREHFDASHCIRDVDLQNPFVVFDIGYAALVQEIVVFQREGSVGAASKKFRIDVGNDVENLATVLETPEMWHRDSEPIRLSISPQRPVRFLKLVVLNTELFDLGNVKIYELSFQKNWGMFSGPLQATADEHTQCLTQ